MASGGRCCCAQRTPSCLAGGGGGPGQGWAGSSTRQAIAARAGEARARRPRISVSGSDSRFPPTSVAARPIPTAASTRATRCGLPLRYNARAPRTLPLPRATAQSRNGHASNQRMHPSALYVLVCVHTLPRLIWFTAEPLYYVLVKLFLC